MHMKEAIDRLMYDFNAFTKEHAGFNRNDDGAASSLNDMKDMLASLPQFQETRDKVGVEGVPQSRPYNG
jgi:syntaxin-binding protein 1